MALDRELDRAKSREKERERRRLRDRQRRHGMSEDQREKHLARRRKNYQLRRFRAQNSQCIVSQQTAETHTKLIKAQLEFHVDSKTQAQGGAQKKQNFRKRLPVRDIKRLARTLHGDATVSCVSTRRLRLGHVKRLARTIMMNDTVKGSGRIVGFAD